MLLFVLRPQGSRYSELELSTPANSDVAVGLARNLPTTQGFGPGYGDNMDAGPRIGQCYIPASLCAVQIPGFLGQELKPSFGRGRCVSRLYTPLSVYLKAVSTTDAQ